MNITLVLGAIGLWGLWGFFGKISENRIGLQIGFWSGLTFFLTIFFYLLFTHQLFPIKTDVQGIGLAVITGFCSGLAAVLFYILLAKHPAGYLTAVTALYPLITIILSVLFLKEGLSFTKVLGFGFALLALLFLHL